MNPVVMPAPLKDQATLLRELVSDKNDGTERDKIRGMRSIAILSGKGGVGKSNLAVNLALALAEKGMRMAILDADLGLANIDILFGVMPKFNLGHVLRGDKELSDIILKVSERVSIIPGGAGLKELADIDAQRQSWMISRLSVLEDETDILLLDTSAGIHKNVISFAMASDLTLLLTTPEPTAIRDSYSVLKSLVQTVGTGFEARIVVNMVSNEAEGLSVAERISSAAEQFLDFKVPYLGCIIYDPAIREAVKNRRPLLLDNPDSISALYFKSLANKICESDSIEVRPSEDLKESFLRRLVRQLVGKGEKNV